MAAYDGLYETAHNLVIFILDGAIIRLTSISSTKTEKFDDEHALYAILRASIKQFRQFNSSVLDFDRDANLDTPIIIKIWRLLRHIQVDGSFNPFG
jgi:DNA mismatch repair protein MutL